MAITQATREEPIDYFKRAAADLIKQETAGGLVLIGCSIIALVLANIPFQDKFHLFWEKKFGFQLDTDEFLLPLHQWVNDGLMVIFFLMMGLEVKREILAGKLSSVAKAALPSLAALGGMLFPAGVFLLVNLNAKTISGWGVPMATDIAYSLGVLRLLGDRVPQSLKIFLSALAIIDDIGAVLVISIFYSSNLHWLYLGIAGAILAALVAVNKLGVRGIAIYALFGIPLWLCFLKSGVHPTIAGVLLAFTVPLRSKIPYEEFQDKTRRHLENLQRKNASDGSIVRSEKQHAEVKGIEKATQKLRSPLLIMEQNLSPINAFIVMPIFALANAGVSFKSGWTEVLFKPLSLGILLGLIVGKFAGVVTGSFISLKTGFGQLPEGMDQKGLWGIGLVAGMGFTMSLFISEIAFKGENLATAKIAILLASALAGILAVMALLFLYRNGSGGESPKAKKEGEKKENSYQ